MKFKDACDKTQKWIKYNSKQHIVDSTALIVVASPIASVMEVFTTTMTNDISIRARFFAAGLVYAGIGSLLARGRDGWRKLFKVTQKSKEKVQYVCDAVYGAVFNLGFQPVFYYIAGSRDITQIATLTVIGMGLGTLTGGIIGHSIDVFRDLTGIKESERLPKYIKELGPKMKIAVAAGLITAFFGISSGIYKTNSYFDSKNNPPDKSASAIE